MSWKNTNILILGSGGREHAFAWKIRQSPLCGRLFVAPGNAGTAAVAENVPLPVTDFEGIASFALANQIELIVVGPEEPLVKGIRDYFTSRSELRPIHLIGPGKQAAQLEGSKDFAKAFMQRHGIPTAGSRTFTAAQVTEALDYVENHSLPIVLKADGLAAGKGVLIAPTVDEAAQVLREMLVGKKFGEAGAKVVVEEFLAGIELSAFVLTDGQHYKILPEAKDYKRIGEGDTGLNTGGMGAVSPVPFADAAFMQKVETRIVQPTIRGLQREKMEYVGFVFIGLMNINGEPFVIEYNVRMGDPETEVVIPRLQSDLVELLLATAQHKLDSVAVQVDIRPAATVMLVSGGYPGEYESGKVIYGLNALSSVIPFHAATQTNRAGDVVTNGGRVLSLTAVADTLEEALQQANQAADQIQWENKYYRRDIGVDLINYRSEPGLLGFRD